MHFIHIFLKDGYCAKTSLKLLNNMKIIFNVLYTNILLICLNTDLSENI